MGAAVRRNRGLLRELLLWAWICFDAFLLAFAIWMMTRQNIYGI